MNYDPKAFAPDGMVMFQVNRRKELMAGPPLAKPLPPQTVSMATLGEGSRGNTAHLNLTVRP